ncbi:MAG: FAD-dependent oxidoreductase [Phycisphaeraceae bacterium]
MIERRPQHVADEHFDVIVIGGGVHGIFTALEAARRGLRPVVVERADFGGGASFNTLRILHGGLRYLQVMNLSRYFASLAERRWFAQHLPDLIRVMPCVMPLHARGLKRSAVMRAALALDGALSQQRNRGVASGLHIPQGRVVDPTRAVSLFPGARRGRLEGAAVWHELVMPAPQRVVIELLHWACGVGAAALNYTRVAGLRVRGGCVVGVDVVDELDGARYAIHASIVVNCAGPGCVELGASDRASPDWPAGPALAFNVLLDVEPPADAALAVQPRRAGAPVYFLHPLRGRLLAGTAHLPAAAGGSVAAVTEQQVGALVADLNEAVPTFKLGMDQVCRVHAGLVPARRAGEATPAARPRIVDHARHGGPAGLVSVAGVKFTTARRVAECALDVAWRPRGGLPGYRPAAARPASASARGIDLVDTDELFRGDDAVVARALRELIEHEAVTRLEDLIERRTDWAVSRAGVSAVRARLQSLGVDKHAATCQMPT